MAGFVAWSGVSFGCTHLFKLVLRPDQIRAPSLWLVNLQNNVSIFAGALAAVGCFAVLIYFSRNHVTFSRLFDRDD